MVGWVWWYCVCEFPPRWVRRYEPCNYAHSFKGNPQAVPEFIEEVLLRRHLETHSHIMAQVEVELLLDSEYTRQVLTPIELIALNCAMDRRPECTGPNLRSLRNEIGSELHNLRVRYGPFEARVERDHLGELRIIAERLVVIDGGQVTCSVLDREGRPMRQMYM